MLPVVTRVPGYGAGGFFLVFFGGLAGGMNSLAGRRHCSRRSVRANAFFRAGFGSIFHQDGLAGNA
jgi:hypothetical protein